LGGGAGAAGGGGSGGLALTLAAAGRTHGGGQLHPRSGSVYYGGATYAASKAEGYMYANLCVELAAAPAIDDVEGVSLAWGECGTRYSDENDLQRFKFGYDWTVQQRARQPESPNPTKAPIVSNSNCVRARLL
jgi:hypothetical protein